MWMVKEDIHMWYYLSLCSDASFLVQIYQISEKCLQMNRWEIWKQVFLSNCLINKHWHNLKRKLDWNQSQLMDKKEGFGEAVQIFNMEDSPRNYFKIKCMKHHSEQRNNFFLAGAALVSVMSLTKPPLSLWLSSSEHTLDTSEICVCSGRVGNVSLMFSLRLWPAIGKRWALQDLRLTCSNTNLIHLCLPFIYTQMYLEEEGHVF